MFNHIDYETFSKVSIKTHGGIRYSEDPSTEILMMAYFDKAKKPRVWVPEKYGYYLNADGNEDAARKAATEAEEIHAFNANFEKGITLNVATRLHNWTAPPTTSYRDTAALVASLSLPRSLAGAADALQIPINKDPRGKKLIRLFCVPRKPTKKDSRVRVMPDEAPDDFEDFIEYCRQDIVVEKAVSDKVDKFKLIPLEQKVWELDSTFNFRGVPIDQKTVATCIKLIAEYSGKLTKIVLDITGGLKPTQRDKLLQWSRANGCYLENLQAATIDDVLKNKKGLIPDDTYQVLKIRRSLGRSSTKKLISMSVAASLYDGRVRGTLLYHGASTGRWAGRLMQPHNFPRPTLKNTMLALEIIQTGNLELLENMYPDPMEAISSCLRHMICAPDGFDFLVADYSSIEARIVCWLAGQEDALRRYRAGEDSYIDMAAYVFGVAVKDVTDDQRALGKAIILGCGFSMGVDTFIATCKKDGIAISYELAKKAVYGFRKKYARVKKYWSLIGDAAMKAVKTGRTQTVFNIKIGVVDDFLLIRLPSGRRLAYPYPKVEMKMAQWGQLTETITFFGKLPNTHIYGRSSTYGGKLVENITQAVARDLMAVGKLTAEDRDYPVITSIHDELISLVPEGTGDLKEFENLICELPIWAKGIPLAAKGYRAKRYRKG